MPGRHSGEPGEELLTLSSFYLPGFHPMLQDWNTTFNQSLTE